MKTKYLRLSVWLFSVMSLLGLSVFPFGINSITSAQIPEPTPTPLLFSNRGTDADGPQPADPSLPSQNTVTVSSIVGWQETPLFLQVGDEFSVSYISGTWTVDYQLYSYVGPDGYSPEEDSQIFPGCKEVSSLPYARLLGAIGDTGPTFSVGSGGTFTADTSGYLFLRINDIDDCLVDNDGSVVMDLSMGTDTTPPTVNWIAPVGNGEVYSASSGIVNLEVSAEDDSGIDRVRFWRWDAVNEVEVELGVDYSPPYQSTVDVGTLNMGWNEIDADAWDIHSNSGNNYIWIDRVESLTIDLEVTDIVASQDPICVGSNVDFIAYIQNNGSQESGDFNIQWDVDGQQLYGGHGSIPAGGTDTHSHFWENIPGGQHTLTFIADYDNLIPESNETNNQHTETFWVIECTGVPNVMFSSAFYSVDEGAGAATITVLLSEPSIQAVTVDYATSDGTATAGSDYIASSGTLTFNPGQTSKTFTVSILEDALTEPDETINLNLSNPNNAFLGTPSDAILTILDNDTGSYYSISGRVTDANSNSISGVTISDGAGHSATTGSNGNYNLSGLDAGTYTITPTKNGYTFSPSTRTVSVPPNKTGVNFIGNATPPHEKSWTLMYYFAADNNLDTALTDEYSRMRFAGMNPVINVVAFYDGFYSPARYIAFTQNGPVGPFFQGELNTGDPSTLANFISWAKTNYPASNYALIISDHGHGLGGVAYDQSSNNDYLNPKEVRQALTNTGKVAVLYMHACLVGNLDFQYEMRGLVDYYVASESIAWGPTSHNSYAVIMNSQTTAEALSIMMASSYYNQWRKPENPSTISAIKMSEVDNVASKASALGASIRHTYNTSGIAVWQVTDASILQRFDDNGNGNDNGDPLADLYHFAWLVGDLNEPEITSAANELMSALDNFVVYNKNWGGTYLNAHGISVVLPRNRLCFYTSDWLDFAAGANWFCDWQQKNNMTKNENALEWGPMIVELIEKYNPNGPEDLYPPDPVPLKVWMPVYLPIVSFVR